MSVNLSNLKVGDEAVVKCSHGKEVRVRCIEVNGKSIKLRTVEGVCDLCYVEAQAAGVPQSHIE